MLAERRLTKLSARVRRGAALLDAEIPGWASRVDLNWLNMNSLDSCVLAQVFGTLDAGIGRLNIIGCHSPSEFGLTPTLLSHLIGTARRDYLSLTLLWAAEVIARRRRAAARRFVAPPKVQAPVLV